MSTVLKSIKLLVVGLIMISQTGFAQKTFNIDGKPSLKVSGTSSMHDWTMTSEAATGKLTGTESGGKLTAISSLTVEMQAESLKSGKNGMDKKAYEALKTDKHKTAKFVLSKATKNSDGSWTLAGTFTFAGTSKQVSLKATESASGGAYTLKGTYDFKLTDYKITPPTALMGTIKTGDAVTVSYTVRFK